MVEGVCIVKDSAGGGKECCGGKITGTLDETGLQGEGLTNVRIRFMMERILRDRNFGGVVVPSVVSDVLGRLTELLEHLIENILSVLGNIELYLDVSNNRNKLVV